MQIASGFSFFRRQMLAFVRLEEKIQKQRSCILWMLFATLAKTGSRLKGVIRKFTFVFASEQKITANSRAFFIYRSAVRWMAQAIQITAVAMTVSRAQRVIQNSAPGIERYV
jgi:hypothetical protein